MDIMDTTQSQEHGNSPEDVADLIKSPATDAFTFNEREQTILKLWDQEEEIRLELNLLKAQSSSRSSGFYKLPFGRTNCTFRAA
jgi:hypothetical protein